MERGIVAAQRWQDHAVGEESAEAAEFAAKVASNTEG